MIISAFIRTRLANADETIRLQLSAERGKLRVPEQRQDSCTEQIFVVHKEASSMRCPAQDVLKRNVKRVSLDPNAVDVVIPEQILTWNPNFSANVRRE